MLSVSILMLFLGLRWVDLGFWFCIFGFCMKDVWCSVVEFSFQLLCEEQRDDLTFDSLIYVSGYVTLFTFVVPIFCCNFLIYKYGI